MLKEQATNATAFSRSCCWLSALESRLLFSSTFPVRSLAFEPARRGACPTLSKLAVSGVRDGGFAAPPCGKAPPFRAVPRPSFSFPRAGRLSLPARGEEVVRDARAAERRSLSARQAAEPQITKRRDVCATHGGHAGVDTLESCGILKSARVARGSRAFQCGFPVAESLTRVQVRLQTRHPIIIKRTIIEGLWKQRIARKS